VKVEFLRIQITRMTIRLSELALRLRTYVIESQSWKRKCQQGVEQSNDRPHQYSESSKEQKGNENEQSVL